MNKFINKIYSTVPCHRKPERCCSLNGEKLHICSRCMAIYPMYLLYPLAVIYTDLSALWILYGILLLLPLIIDGLTQKKYNRESNTFLRITTGILFGLGQILLISVSSKIVWWYVKEDFAIISVTKKIFNFYFNS